MHNQQILDFIKENSSLFWYIQEDKKDNISIELLVETILNFGDEKSVKKLFDLIGINRTAEIFYDQTQRKRVNYNNRTIHFFNLYFQRHAQGDIIKTTA